MKTSVPIYYRDKPLFGLDIGNDTLKVVQLSESSDLARLKERKPKIIGYGYNRFDRSAIKDGVIIKPQIIAEAAKELLDKKIKGTITTNRVAIAIPAYRTFSRSIKIPNLSKKQIKEAIELEAEQYIAFNIDDLYIDYEIIRHTLSDELEVLIVAVPKVIVDSYTKLAEMLNLEVLIVEPTLSSSGRLFSIDEHSRSAAVIIDFGALSSDISLYDKSIVVSGTIEGGGLNFTDLIRKILRISPEEAEIAKTRYGLSPSKKQDEIKRALQPTLEKIIKEVRRMLRYYEERYGTTRPIKQIVTLGGGANMPGLSEYLTENLRMAVRHGDPWQFIECKKIKAPSESEKSMYTNAIGLALIDPKKVYKA